MKMTFGEQIHVARKRKGLKAHEVAALAGVSEYTVYAIESGKVRSTSFYIALRLCSALGIALEDAAAGVLYELLPPTDMPGLPEEVRRRLARMQNPRGMVEAKSVPSALNSP